MSNPCHHDCVSPQLPTPAFLAVTPAYVDIITNYQYTSRTANVTEFEALRLMLAEAWLTTRSRFLPSRKYTHGLALLIAHYYATGPKDLSGGEGSSGEIPPDNIAGATGPITSEKVGDIAITYGALALTAAGGSTDGSAFSAWLSMSIYGMQFQALMQSFNPTPLVL
jgi:hypothetical protein